MLSPLLLQVMYDLRVHVIKRNVWSAVPAIATLFLFTPHRDLLKKYYWLLMKMI